MQNKCVNSMTLTRTTERYFLSLKVNILCLFWFVKNNPNVNDVFNNTIFYEEGWRDQFQTGFKTAALAVFEDIT